MSSAILPNYVLTIDQSTSASKIMLFDSEAGLVHRISKPHRQFYPNPGFVEHDAEEIFENVRSGMIELVKETGISEEQIKAVAITNQRETALIWDKNTGKPVANAAVWQCQRGNEYCDKLKISGHETTIREKTGLIIDPYFSASKLRWMMRHIDSLSDRAASGDLLLGTMDSWLLWKLTNGKVHATDYSNACRTMLFNIKTLQWDPELIELFDLHVSMFPEVRYSDEIFGHTSDNVILNRPIPIAGLVGDSHGALFGQRCFSAGLGKATYGTGSSVMMNIGTAPLDPPDGLVTSIGFGCNKQIHYVFEGNIHCTGDTINWLKNELGIINDPAETEILAKSLNDNEGVYLVPAFVGLGAPYWNNSARACISGLSRSMGKAHIARAALESIAYQIGDLIDLMGSEEDVQLIEIRADGGPTRNEFLMQFQADVLQMGIVRSSIEEVSALGSTYLAGLATGLWNDLAEIANLKREEKSFHPAMPTDKVHKLLSGWKKAVAKVQYDPTSE